MSNNNLDDLTRSGTIKEYKLYTINGDTGESGKPSKNGCNYERLVLEFNDGKKLEIETSCSGVLENTHMFFKVE